MKTLSFKLICVSATADAGGMVTYGLASPRSLADGFVQTMHVRLAAPDTMVLGRTYTVTVEEDWEIPAAEVLFSTTGSAPEAGPLSVNVPPGSAVLVAGDELAGDLP